MSALSERNLHALVRWAETQTQSHYPSSSSCPYTAFISRDNTQSCLQTSWLMDQLEPTYFNPDGHTGGFPATQLCVFGVYWRNDGQWITVFVIRETFRLCQTFAQCVLLRQVSWQENAGKSSFHSFLFFVLFLMYHGSSSAPLLLRVFHPPLINHCEQWCCLLKNTMSLHLIF